MIRGKYQRCRYAYIHFSSQDDLVAARQMKIEFKKGNAGTRQLYWSKEEDRICNICGNPTHMAKDCTNKDINKSQSKRFVSGADNWKNLKKSYADAAKSKQKPRNSSKSNNNIPSGSRDLGKARSNHDNDDDDSEDFNNHPMFLKFKEQIISTIRKVEDKMLKMESLIGDTGKQISEVVTAQQALKCDKAHPVPTSTKKKNQQSVSGAEVKAAKKRCKSDSESSEDEDELANKSVLQSQQFQKSDQNIQSIVAQQKQIQENHKETKSLLSSLYNIETNLSYRQSKIWQQQFGFHGYFDYSQQGGKGQGVGIIVSNKYDIFVHKAVGHKGRVIYLDLNFSQKKNVRLIQVYINANKKERTQIEELYQYIENTIDDAKNKNMEIIIMGDFNINYRKYLMAFVNNRWYFKLFKMLENRHLLDTIPIFNEDDENIYTYIPPNDSNEKSRIDYIWASLPILGQSLNSTVIENDHFTTDHNTVTLSLDTQLFIGKTLPKINKSKKKITRTVFLYDEMDQEDDEFIWDNFRAGLDHEIERLKLKDRSITKRKHVDHVWDSLRQLIMKSANENIKNKKVIKQKIKCAPEKKLSVYFDLRYIINRIQEIRSCITGLRNYPNQETIDKWINYQNTIIKLKYKYELVTSDTSFNFLNNDQFHSYLDELNEIRKQLRIVFKLELNIMEQEQIISNIKKRCDNYKDDQGRMIQSITEKEMVSISIEKIYKKDHNGNEVLITDENQVMEETNRHFQTVAGSVNRKKPIQGRWKEQYKPQPHINENIYSGIMDAPSYDEWLDIIRQLSNGKATGPSGVSNEMLKHLSDDCNHILYYLICKIIELGYLPKQWKEATVFPIAKPKPFNCELSNSRPITLLETTRKALISLLNRRLAIILKDNNILKANQFAGLPKQSTFEPIRIMNEVIQDSIDNNNELWILSQDMGKAYDRVNIFQLKKAMDRIKIPNDFSSLILELFKDRKNQVITAYGKTTPYDVLTGIDQGEVISLLLWCIYYDPLLAEIDKQQLGYNISCISKSVVQEEGVLNQQNVSIMAYMDDTQWITDEKSKLEKMLYIADTFYRLNDIQINKEKSELMMRSTTEKHQE
ncbi:unnamed protein product [Rhizophagus irregularis]|uniref:Reverse transcriptase domain-containing protein n=1 Tax=Rhizophagus irregularis TaxID=588596 RepID=A0A916DZH2_9GLOM|nr:unnamed protein product [Rhizophagus irregularis]